jgi:hypothetical protein
VFTAGDNAYPSGTSSNFSTYYHPFWGRSAIKSRTFPTPGNHDYQTSGANGYYIYFGAVASRTTGGFYTKSLGSFWVGIFMNTETGISAQTSKLETALQQAKAISKNVVVVWHKPRFAIGTKPGVSALQPWWNLMDQYDVDISIVGHEHFYARVGPRLASGAANASGTREFVVGTGGAQIRSCTKLPTMTEKCIAQHGITVFTLRRTSYSWQFRNISSSVLDSGTAGVIGVHP